MVAAGLVAAGTPIGVLAYAGERAVGWCSVAPRESYVKLQSSRTMPRVSGAPTWMGPLRSAYGNVRALPAPALRAPQC